MYTLAYAWWGPLHMVASPMRMVPKTTANGGTYRLCGDYRHLNKITIKGSYPIPNAQSLFHRLAGSTIFSKIDLIKAYYQILVDPASIRLRAIFIPFVFFEYLYIPFGLVNASSTFQRFIDHVLEDMNNVIAYVDDLIIFSSSFKEHKTYLAQLFLRLSQFNIAIINPTKLQFGLKNLNFLGHLVTPDGILLLPERVEILQKYTTPHTCKQLRTYFGFINYYHRFLPKLAHCLTSLYDLIKNPNKRESKKRKSEAITWTSDAENAFTRSKKLLSDATLLAYPEPDL